MKKLFGFLTNRWLLAVLGLAMLAAGIWLIGPLISIGGSTPLVSPMARLVTILVVVLFWGVNQFRKVLRANKANQGMVDGLVEAEAAEPDRSSQEVALLKERFEQAMQVLKKAKGKGRRLSLYDLPWYIIIGPPGSGKTTALVNSGLDFPLADRFGRESLGGIGGTRNCDWWFTDDAILLDTAGRYTTQDSDTAADRSAWEGFLGLLKKHRRRRPINGVVVAISLLDLMTQNEHERAAHARAIKQRIQELDQFFKIRFPVYVILTKTDLVAGFNEYFDDFGRNEREQVWGMTFPIEASESSAGPVELIDKEFDALLERLNSRVLLRMSQERDPRRRAAIYGFPRQLASLEQNLEGFLGDVFRGSRFEQAPMLRGVYLTSGTQEGTPIDRLMGMVARTFGLDQQAYAARGGQGRSYFIKSLLTDVMFRESEIAGANRKLELQRAWLQRAAYAGCLVLSLAAVAGWTWSYFNNVELVSEVQAATQDAAAAVDDVSGNNLDVLSVLPVLDSARSIPGGYADRDRGASLAEGLGLYQGRKLGRQAESAYRRVLTKILLPRLILRLERQMRGGGTSPEFQYEALKTYLMLDSREHYDSAEVIAWFQAADFNTNLPREVTTAQRDALRGHLEALFAEQPVPLSLPLDPDLITDMQRVVARIPTENRIYSRLKTLSRNADLADFSVIDAAGPRASLVFARKSGAQLSDGIDGFFTRDGYRRYFLTESVATVARLVDESWILGDYAPSGLDVAQLQSRVRELYLDEYAKQYEDLLLDVELAPFATAQEASGILNELSRPKDSPLVLLLRGVAEQTQLETQVTNAAQTVSSRVSQAAENLRNLIGGGQQQEQRPIEAPANAVEQRLAWVREFVGGESSDSAPVQHVLSLLDDLYRFMTLVVSEGGAQGDIPATVAQQGQLAVQQLRTEAARQPEMVKGLLSTAASRSQSIAFSGVMANLNNEWRSRGYEFCSRAIEGRFPVSRDSAEEIRLNDFGEFFRPGGIMDGFFRDFLTDYVDTTKRPWRARSSATTSVRISAEALAQFERGRLITETFFRTGSPKPSVTFELTPVGMDQNINQFTLELEGQTVNYSHGPLVTSYLEWPGPQPTGEVRIQMTPAMPGSSMTREQGAWAWFRVLRSANIRPADRPEVFEVEFALGQRTALYRLQARSAYNPFDFDELAQFACPASL